jgi:hypothetical protein
VVGVGLGGGQRAGRAAREPLLVGVRRERQHLRPQTGAHRLKLDHRANLDHRGRIWLRFLRVDATFIFMMFVLKLPILALFWIVWWAIHAKPEPGAQDGQDRGGGPPVPQPSGPRPPWPRRRGPHGDPAPASPARSRSSAPPRP